MRRRNRNLFDNTRGHNILLNEGPISKKKLEKRIKSKKKRSYMALQRKIWSANQEEKAIVVVHALQKNLLRKHGFKGEAYKQACKLEENALRIRFLNRKAIVLDQFPKNKELFLVIESFCEQLEGYLSRAKITPKIRKRLYILKSSFTGPNGLLTRLKQAPKENLFLELNLFDVMSLAQSAEKLNEEAIKHLCAGKKPVYLEKRQRQLKLFDLAFDFQLRLKRLENGTTPDTEWDEWYRRHKRME